MASRFDYLAGLFCVCVSPVAWNVTGQTVTVCGLCGRDIREGEGN